MLRTQRLVLKLAACALTLGALTAVQAAPAAAYSGQETIFQDDIQLKADPVGFLATMKQFGVDRVRVFLTWKSVAPSPKSTHKPRGFNATDPAAYPASGWGIYDAIDRSAARDGIKVYFDLTGPAPYWAAHGGPRDTNGVWEPSGHEFKSFVEAVGKRYDGTFDPGDGTLPAVDYWGIWNEPDYGVDLSPQTIHGPTVEVAPALYRDLVDAAWSGLHATGHGSDTILIGELAPRGQTSGGLPGVFGGMVPIRFLRALYCVDSRLRPLRGRFAAQRGCPSTSSGSRSFARRHPGLFRASGFADHPYPQGQAPLVSTWVFGGENLYTDWTQLPALERLLDGVQRTYGQHRRYPIYNTEFGEQIPRVSQSKAAYYLNWFEWLSWRDRRIATFDQYLLVNPSTGRFPSAIEDSHGRRLATYDAFRLPLYMPVTRGRRGRSLEVWGDVRPAKYDGGSNPVLIQFQAGSRGAFTTVKQVMVTSSRGYFDTRVVFPGGGTVRLEWSYGSGATIQSRSQKITVR
jgi:hypothetical protein